MNCYVIYEKIVIVLNAVITKLFIIIYVLTVISLESLIDLLTVISEQWLVFTVIHVWRYNNICTVYSENNTNNINNINYVVTQYESKEILHNLIDGNDYELTYITRITDWPIDSYIIRITDWPIDSYIIRITDWPIDSYITVSPWL
jgi:hypothetical protein